MSPDGVIAVACVLTAPGKSNEVKSDFELGADEAPDVCAGATEVRNTYPNKAMSRKSLGIARNPPQDAASEPYFYFRKLQICVNVTGQTSLSFDSQLGQTLILTVVFPSWVAAPENRESTHRQHRSGRRSDRRS